MAARNQQDYGTKDYEMIKDNPHDLCVFNRISDRGNQITACIC
jgi:hypothetical protein